MSDGLTGGALSPWLILLRDLSVKSALLMLAAWVLTLAMRRTSAATRHLVWLLTFAGLLLLPLLSVTLPARSIAVLPPPAAPVVLPSPVVTPSVAVESLTIAVADRRPVLPLPAPILPPRPVAPSALPPASPDWPVLFCCLWLMGVAFASLPLITGWLLATRRLRLCAPVTDPAILALAAEAGYQLGLRRPIIVRSGPSVSVPVTFGLLRPVILLPDGAAFWPTERLRVALLHELAHIRRGDWATQTAARLVCALFWHNPLVWPAARMLRAEAERACDDLVLSSGIPAPDYAQHLLAVAAALSGANRPMPLAVPMAGRGPLEARLRAVLTAHPRCAPSRRLAGLAFALALIVLVPLAVLRPAARAARQTAPTLPPAPAQTAAIAPPAPVPLRPTPIGNPPMKTPLSVKTLALTALVAGLAPPAAQAKPTTPVRHVPAPILVGAKDVDAVLKKLNADAKAYPTIPAPNALHWNKIFVRHTALKTIMASTPWAQGKNPDGVKRVFFLLGDNSILVDATPAGLARVQEVVKGLDVAPVVAPAVPAPPHDGTLIRFDVDQGSVRDVLAVMFKQEHLNYVIEPGVSGSVDVHLSGVPFDKALDTLVGASSQPLEWNVQEGVYHIRPRSAVVGAKQAVPAAPRQVQIKFEWVSSANTPNAAPDKSVDALTIIAEEGRKAKVSSRHLQNGVGGEETLSVLPRLEPGGVVVLDITERSDSTARVGDTKSNSAETTVRVKDGDTGTVRLQVSKQGGQGAERVLFVTATIIGAGGG